MEAIIDMPDRWDYFDGATYYMIGKFDFVFMWNNKHYHRSQKTEAELIGNKGQNIGNNKGNPAPEGTLKIDIILETIRVSGPLSFADVMELSETVLSTCERAVRALKRDGDISLSEDDLYSYTKKIQEDLFRGAEL